MVLVKSQVKDLTKLNVSKDVYDALEKKVASMIKDAENRATSNGRKTLRAHDF